MRNTRWMGLICATLISFNGMAQPKLNRNNIDKVVKVMTIEEKASLLVGFTQGNSYFGLPSSPDPNAKELIQGAAGQTNGISRLGIPFTVVSDGPAGLRIDPTRKNDTKTYYCTGFPVGTCLASTWNRKLVESVGEAMGNEVREYGVDVILGPGMNIHRNPLCGRNFEYYSEDPVLSGNIAAAMIKGIQSNGVGVSIKHFAANNQESNRLRDDAVVSQRALREIYLKGFEIAVKLAQPWTVMSSYNKINGTYTQESKDLLTTILRDEWGFKGIVMSDWTNTRNTAAQIEAGNDLLMPGNKAQIDDIVAKVKSRELPMNAVDVCVKRVLEYVVKTLRFNGYDYSNKPDLSAHAKVTRQSAVEGMVLLKNDGQTLPLSENTKNIALFGVTSYRLIAGGTGSGDVNKAYVVDLREGLTKAGYKLNEDLNNIYAKYLDYGKLVQDVAMGNLANNAFFGKPRITEPEMPEHAYMNCALNADMAIITIGRNSGEGADRYVEDFTINTDEKNMINDVCKAFHAANKKVVVILNVGGVVETASWKSLPDAILLAWQPGQEGGNSIADVLKGAANPSGKLTMTFPEKLTDVKSTANFPIDFDFRNDWLMSKDQVDALPNVGTTKYEEDIYVGYRYFTSAHKNVSYPFGYGLSYTSFTYNKPKVVKKGKGYVASVTITNTGKCAGKEVVELYVSAPESKIEKPACELKAFGKTRELQPGESETVTMNFTNYDLASYDESSQAWITDAGVYKAKFGSSVEDIKETVPFSATAGKVTAHNVLAPQKELNHLSLK